MLLIGLNLLLSSYGCIVEHRDDDYGRHREEYREHEEHREGGYERGYEERRNGDEFREHEDRD
jgi:hypothetical protein